MKSSDVIKEFLIALGFQTDKKGEKAFNDTLKNATVGAVKLAGAVVAAAGVIGTFATKVAGDLDKLHFTSKRSDASVSNLQLLSYAFKQVGLDANQATNAVESLSGFMNSAPGAENYLSRLGVSTRDSFGRLKDTTKIYTDLIGKLSKMPHYRAVQYGQIFGIDEKTLLSLRGGIGQFTADYEHMLAVTGYDANKAALQSNQYMTSLRSLGELFDMLKNKVGSNIADGLTASIESLRKKILENFPKIEKVITKSLKAIIKMAEYLTRGLGRIIDMVSDLMDWWDRLDKSHRRTITMLAGLALAAWALSSPLMIVAGILAGLLLLYDDYKGWQEGKNSAIDWSKWETEIGWMSDLADSATGVKVVLLGLLGFFTGKFMAGMVTAATTMGTSIGGLISTLSKLATNPFVIGAGFMLYSPEVNSGEDKVIAARQAPFIDLLLKANESGNFTELDRMHPLMPSLVPNNSNSNTQVTINQTNTINATTNGSPVEVVGATVEGINRVNERAVNNIRTGVQ